MPVGSRRPYLGLATLTVHVRANGASRGALLVTAVDEGSPAERAGVLQGDIVLDFDGENVEDDEALRGRLAQLEWGCPNLSQRPARERGARVYVRSHHANGGLMIHVLVISPYPSVRAGLRALLQLDDLKVVWEGAGADDLLDPWPLRPDLAIVDGASGQAIFDRLVSHIPELGIVVLGATTSHIRNTSTMAARGYLPQDANAEELVVTVRTVARGLTVIDPTLLAEVGAMTVVRTTSSAQGEEPLTPRETEVLQLLARGLPNKTIATQLSISEHTAKFHVSAVLSKLGAASRTEAVTLAARRGLLML